MPSIHPNVLLGMVLLCGLNRPPAIAEVSLAGTFPDNMVLQQEKPIPVWGQANAGETVDVQLDDQRVRTTADKHGRWSVQLKARKADSERHELKVRGDNELVLKNIAIGEVWVGVGGSTLRLGQKSHQAGGYPQFPLDMRLATVPGRLSAKPLDSTDLEWKGSLIDGIQSFSAVLSSFGIYVQADINIPLGLLQVTGPDVGIESWLPDSPSGRLFNGMMAPVLRHPVRGVIWYHGAADVLDRQTAEYADRLKSLVAAWRKAWGKDTSVLIVQLPPWKGRYEPGQLSLMWKAQKAVAELPRAGLVMTYDQVSLQHVFHAPSIGQKGEIGRRIGLWALAEAYGRDIVCQGPVAQSALLDDNEVVVSFKNAGNALRVAGRAFVKIDEGFSVAGKDGEFVEAEAQIDGVKLKVWSTEVKRPTVVRYRPTSSPQSRITNDEDLPAEPFELPVTALAPEE